MINNNLKDTNFENLDNSKKLYTEEEVLIIMRGACIDGQKGYMPEALLIDDYIIF